MHINIKQYLYSMISCEKINKINIINKTLCEIIRYWIFDTEVKPLTINLNEKFLEFLFIGIEIEIRYFLTKLRKTYLLVKISHDQKLICSI